SFDPVKAARVRRSAVLLLVLSCAATTVAVGAARVPVAGAASQPLAAVTVSTDVASKPTVKFDKPFTAKKTTDEVVTAGAGAALARATGDAVAPVAGLPTVALAADGKPTITVPSDTAPPTQLVSQVLIKGAGPAVTAGQTLSVHYTGVIWASGKQFDSSWDRG